MRIVYSILVGKPKGKRPSEDILQWILGK